VHTRQGHGWEAEARPPRLAETEEDEEDEDEDEDEDEEERVSGSVVGRGSVVCRGDRASSEAALAGRAPSSPAGSVPGPATAPAAPSGLGAGDCGPPWLGSVVNTATAASPARWLPPQDTTTGCSGLAGVALAAGGSAGSDASADAAMCGPAEVPPGAAARDCSPPQAELLRRSTEGVGEGSGDPLAPVPGRRGGFEARTAGAGGGTAHASATEFSEGYRKSCDSGAGVGAAEHAMGERTSEGLTTHNGAA